MPPDAKARPAFRVVSSPPPSAPRPPVPQRPAASPPHLSLVPPAEHTLLQRRQALQDVSTTLRERGVAVLSAQWRFWERPLGWGLGAGAVAQRLWHGLQLGLLACAAWRRWRRR